VFLPGIDRPLLHDCTQIAQPSTALSIPRSSSNLKHEVGHGCPVRDWLIPHKMEMEACILEGIAQVLSP